MKKQWNHEYIVSIEIIEPTVNKYYIWCNEYKPRFSLFSELRREAGFYNKTYRTGPYSIDYLINDKENIDNNGDSFYFIQSKTVYNKACVYIKFTDGQSFIKRFKTVVECEDYIKDLDFNWSNFITFK